jgi:preprotein translocase subunit SecY
VAAAIPAAVAATAEAAAVANDSPSPTTIGLVSFGTTFVVVIALFAAGILSLWLAAVILVVDGVFTYMLTARLGRSA